MFPGLTSLGQFHTLVSEVSIVLGLVAFFRDGKIDLRNRVGQGYLATMLVASVTAFGISRSGGFSVGHSLTIVTLVFLLAGTFVDRVRGLGRSAAYVQTISFSTSYFLLMFFATTETLTRLPVAHPFASSQDDPALLPVRVALLAAYLLGIAYQSYELHSSRTQAVPQPVRVQS
jgi:uncharacterized membrane protein